MRHVEHDPAAARAAAHRCRDAAGSYLRIAATVGADPRRVSWWGCERDLVVAAATELADDLRREARALQATADLLEAAARAAERREAVLAAGARAAIAAEQAAPCAVLASAPTTGHSQTSPQRGRGGSTSHAGGVPAGLR